MSEILHEHDCSSSDLTKECVNYVNFKIATKQLYLSTNTMFTTFHVYVMFINDTKPKVTTTVTDWCLVEARVVGNLTE